MFCPNCGYKVAEDALFCSKCGSPISQTTENLYVIDSDYQSITPFETDDEEFLLSKANALFQHKSHNRLLLGHKIVGYGFSNFLVRIKFSIYNEIKLVYFNSTSNKNSEGGWLITNRKIYKDSFSKDDPIPHSHLVEINIGKLENILICKTDKTLTELDFADTEGFRMPVAKLLEVLVNKVLLSKSSNKSSNDDFVSDFPGDSQIICPHCMRKGFVTTRKIKRKAGISGGKATAAILTGGLSLLAAGLSRKEELTEAYCANCNATWHF